MFADPITIEKEGEIFDIFFIDSEGIMAWPSSSPTDRQNPMTDFKLETKKARYSEKMLH